MKKRLIAMALISTMLVTSLVACGNKGEDKKGDAAGANTR